MHSLSFHKGILFPGDYYYYYILLLYTGTDEKAIILVLTRRSNEQRQEIKVKFKVKYGKVQIEQWFQSRDNNNNNNNKTTFPNLVWQNSLLSIDFNVLLTFIPPPLYYT